MDIRPSFFPRIVRYILAVAVFIVVITVSYSLFEHYASARYITTISDTITTSAPNAFANHTIEFQINTDIPASGYIRVRPDDGKFIIPTSTFSIADANLIVSTNNGPYVLRTATATPSATADGIGIVTGTSGSVTFTLNSTTGISAGSRVRIVLGSNAVGASTTIDTGFQNPGTIGSYSVYIDAGGGLDAYAHAMIAIIDQVGVGPANTRSTLPALRFNGAPIGQLSYSTLNVELSLETDSFAKCRYSLASGTPYSTMLLLFNIDNPGYNRPGGSGFNVIHTTIISGLTENRTYNYYVRCIDDQGNINPDDYLISFTIPPKPTGSPGTGSTTNAGGGGASGTGTGNSGSGSGSSAGGGGGGGSGGSGGGGGSSIGNGGGATGAGSFEPTPAPYESGDAQVIINGFAFPNSIVTILVDGYPAVTTRTTGDGQFSGTISAIARGVYTFGVFAVDSQSIKSSTFSTSFSVIGARTSSLSNVHIMPTIKVTPNPADPDSTVTFSGHAIPNSVIAIETQRDKTTDGLKTLAANSDGSGAWSLAVPTTGFARDTWKVRAKSSNATLGISSQFSNYTYYGVGAAGKKTLNSDLNRDGRVNLVDFSILLFHWNTSGGNSNPPADINGDGRVNLTDFSIMIFNWTG